MSAQLIDGKKIAKEREAILTEQVTPFRENPPVLAILLVGSHPASLQYVNLKQKVGERIGIRVIILQFPEQNYASDLSNTITSLNQEKTVTGILLQLPLPDKADPTAFLDAIAPEKDVDGLSSISLSAIGTAEQQFIPAVCRGILTLFHVENIKVKDEKVTVIGQSPWVGKPISKLLTYEGAIVTGADHNTPDLHTATITADILITATGVPKLVTSNLVKEGATVIDVGYGIDPETGKAAGDVAMDSVSSVAAKITPVPGGVGPMTIISLFEQVVTAYHHQQKST